MEESTLEDEFHAAVKLIRSLPKTGSLQPSDSMKLKFYSYYKQVTEGPCTLVKPAFWDLVNRAKWNAWSGLGNMAKEDAMRGYIDEFLQVFFQVMETIPYDGTANPLINNIGPFIKYAPKEIVESFKLMNGYKNEDENFDGKSSSQEDKVVVENTCIASTSKKPVKGNLNIRKNDFHDKPEARLRVASSLNGLSINGSNESDSEEFSDTFDKVNGESDEDIILHASTVNEALYNPPVDNSKVNNIVHVRGGGDRRQESGGGDPVPSSSGNRSSRQPHQSRVNENPSQQLVSSNASGNAGGSRRNNGSVSLEAAADISEQLALAVIRLQHTMEQVVSRLDSLEVLLQERRSNPCKQVSKMNNSFWSMFGISPRAAFLILSWPFVAHWLIHFIRKRRRQ